MKNKNILFGLVAAAAVFVGTPMQAAEILVDADITTSETWTANNVYILNRAIVVKNNAILTIEPGTLVLGVGDNKATTDRADDLYGSLVISRGSKLMAEGTAADPIIFDAYASVYGFDDSGRNSGPSGVRTGTAASRGFPTIQTTNSNGTGTAENPNFGTTPAPIGSPLKSGGLWGGIVILGKAHINFYSLSNTASSQLFEKSIEGFPVANIEDLKYGANSAAEWVNTDNSGTLRYMSLRFGGYEFSTGSEINGLTLGGVGSGTVIENIEVVSNNDDGFEFFGGTVNTKYLVSAFNKDDSFDIDEGHQGVHQFWFAIQNNTTTAVFGDNGLELDGGFSPPISGVDQTNAFAPLTTPDIYNITVIGKGLNEATNHGARMRDQFRGKIHNSLFTDLGVSIRADNTLDGTARPIVNNTVVGNMITGGFGVHRVSTGGVQADAHTIMTTPAATNTSATSATLLSGISRFPNGLLDPRPTPGSLALTHTRTTPPAPINTIVSTEAFNGAFGNTLWVDGWTFLDEKGYLPADAVAPPFTDTDGDEISDAVETANAALGLSPTVNDASTILPTLKTTAQFNANFTAGQNSVTSDPAAFNLYTAASIQNLRGTGMMIGPVTPGENANLSIPLFSSPDLVTWTAAGNATATVPAPAGKHFFRVDVSNNAPNP